jgi:hypothetical protein
MPIMSRLSDLSQKEFLVTCLPLKQVVFSAVSLVEVGASQASSYKTLLQMLQLNGAELDFIPGASESMPVAQPK